MVLILRVAVCAWLSLIAAGCSREAATPASTAKSPADTAEKPAALRKVVMQTDWFPQAEHGGFYQALVKGFYREAGLAVEIWPGGPGAGIKLKVARGDADFGLNRSDDVILAMSRGMPLVMVAASMQHDALALMVHEASPVKTFKDIEGRVVVGNVGLAYFPFLERQYGIKFEKRQNTYGLAEFLTNPGLIQQCLVTNEPFFAQQQGRRVRTLSFTEAGYDNYHAIFCRRELVTQAPDVVRAFVAATIRGWADYLEGDPAAANVEILKRNTQMTPELLAFSRGELIARKLVHGDHAKGERIGQLSLARVTRDIDLLLSLKVLEAPVAAAQVATSDFLPPEALPK